MSGVITQEMKQATVDLNEGLRRTTAWFLENKPRVAL